MARDSRAIRGHGIESEICVVTCVVTLPSLPSSEGLPLCRSGIYDR
jgi:hypothetical protein